MCDNLYSHRREANSFCLSQALAGATEFVHRSVIPPSPNREVGWIAGFPGKETGQLSGCWTGIYNTRYGPRIVCYTCHTPFHCGWQKRVKNKVSFQLTPLNRIT